MGKWGHGGLRFMNGYTAEKTDYTRVRCVDSWQGEVAYCIEPGAPQNNYDPYTAHDENFWKNLPQTNDALTPAQMRDLIGRILVYGYHGTVGNGWYSGTAETADKMAHTMATQYLIWEVITVSRTASSACWRSHPWT